MNYRLGYGAFLLLSWRLLLCQEPTMMEKMCALYLPCNFAESPAKVFLGSIVLHMATLMTSIFRIESLAYFRNHYSTVSTMLQCFPRFYSRCF